MVKRRRTRLEISPAARYVEIAQLIPDVTPTDVLALSDVPFSFMPNILLDSLVPVVVGQNLYGFNKQLASVRTDGDSFDVRSPLGSIGAWFERYGVPGNISQYPGIDAIRNKLEQPLVGVGPDGSFIYSILNFGLSAAAFQPVKGTIKISPHFVQAADTTLTLDPDLWGFRFLSHWSLSLPFNFPVTDPGGPGKSLRRVTAGYADAIFGQFPFRR